MRPQLIAKILLILIGMIFVAFFVKVGYDMYQFNKMGEGEGPVERPATPEEIKLYEKSMRSITIPMDIDSVDLQDSSDSAIGIGYLQERTGGDE